MLEMKYFVLKPGGNVVPMVTGIGTVTLTFPTGAPAESSYADASRRAMLEFARQIATTDPELAESLEQWVRVAQAYANLARGFA